MGTFASLFQKPGTGVPDEKKEEFRERIEKLYRAGGMMKLEHIELCGRKAVTMKQASMHDCGMNFYYNYYEDAVWENAGFDFRECRVWSEKIGWAEFHSVVVAAYVLESLYIDGPATVMVNGEWVGSDWHVGWLNYLFRENYQQKNRDPWALMLPTRNMATLLNIQRKMRKRTA